MRIPSTFTLARICLVSVVVALLGACTQTISSAGPNAATLLPAPLKASTTKDLTAVAINFDNAAKVGWMDPADDAGICSHLINQQLGIEAVAGAAAPTTATLTNAGLFSAGSILVIDASEAATMLRGGGLSLPENCVVALGKLQASALGQLFGVKVTFLPSVTTTQLQAMVQPAGTPAAAPAK